MSRFTVLLATLLAAFFITACQPRDKALQAEDETNPHIREAMNAMRSQAHNKAATAFEQALAAAPTLARPHYELGLLYADHLYDPISAMFHFQRFIKLQPNAQETNVARKRLEAIRITFAATVPNSPIQNAEAFAQLQGDNQNLRRELDDLRSELRTAQAKLQAAQTQLAKASPTLQMPAPPLVAVRDTPDAPPQPPAGSTTNTELPPPSDNGTLIVPATPAIEVQLPNSPALAPDSPASPASPTAPRSHTVVAGDTLWKIARKYYPRDINAGIERIRNANAGKPLEPLKLGITLVIPE